MAACNSNKIVVWERSNKLGKWCPYPPEICHFLEQSFMKDLSEVSLGENDESLRIYSVNFKDMIQVSDATGTKSPLRRQLYDSLSVLGRGFSWQWHDDHDAWNIYDVDVNNYIDIAFLEGRNSINLSKKFPGYNYEIVFTKMIQINKRTKRKRKIRRFDNSSSYPIEQGSKNSEEDPSNVQTENKDDPKNVQTVLTPEFLAQEIPGTAALLNQVNTYKRNVESPEFHSNCINLTQDDVESHTSHKHLKCSNEDDEKANSMQGSSQNNSTVALVDGRPWYDSRPPHTPQSLIKPVPGIDPLPKLEKPKKQRRKKGAVASCPDEILNLLEKYTEIVDSSLVSGDESCIICCESLSSASSYNDDNAVSKLTLCSHVFHKACIEAMYNSGNKEFLQCPSCKQIHGEKCGSQPPGEMVYHILPYSLPGYPENDTIRIIYDIHGGIQGPEQPNPGRRYSARGFPRHCYLPDNEMGRKILRLLVKAWKRRLIFTIGRSSTTGEEGTVTWNEIHHKTEFGCNRRGHGYPDPNYFSNVLAELEAHGVTDDEVHVWHPV